MMQPDSVSSGSAPSEQVPQSEGQEVGATGEGSALDGFDQALHDAYADGRRDEAERWERRTEVMHAQLAHAREQNARLLDILTGIHGLLPSPPIEANGKTYVFQDPNANETLRMLRTRIMAVTESVAAIRNASILSRRALGK